jgi:selenocysteine lyase/cysteine desulfurase
MITHGTTEGVHVVLHGFPWRPGDEMVTCNLEHPAIATPSNVLEERKGVVVKRVELPPDGEGGEEEILARIGEAITSSTRIVALSHIQYSCGLRLPVKAIAEIAHQQGALVLVDGAQTGGHIEIKARDLGADFYSISGQKWLLGPNGTGAMYMAREHLRDIDPLFQTHTLADQRAEGMLNARPMGRFRVTSQSPALTAGFATAVGIFNEIGMDVVEAHNLALADRLRDGVESIKGAALTGPATGSSRCALVSVSIEGWEPAQVVDDLWTRTRIAARSVGFPAGVRFSCASFNNESDIDKAIAALRDIASRRPPEPDPDAPTAH